MITAFLFLAFFFTDKKACLPGRVEEIPVARK
jgi:hypothetical protein